MRFYHGYNVVHSMDSGVMPSKRRLVLSSMRSVNQEFCNTLIPALLLHLLQEEACANLSHDLRAILIELLLFRHQINFHLT